MIIHERGPPPDVGPRDTAASPPRWRCEAEALERNHPGLYQRVLGDARRAKASGLARCCVRRLLDDARAEGGYKVGNAAGPLLARLLLERHPDEFAGWIATKRGGVDEADDTGGGDRTAMSGGDEAARRRLLRIHAAWAAARPPERKAFLAWVVARHDAEAAESGRTTLL